MMEDVFFMATKHGLRNITSVYDMVWPISVGLWNLRCMVAGIKKEFPDVTESQFADKFSLGSNIHGVNYKRAFLETSWEQQKKELAWVLLNHAVPVFEGWLEELKRTVFFEEPSLLRVKELQFPGSAQAEITRLQSHRSNMLTDAFHSSYAAKRDRDFGSLNAWLSCYRVFKEMRNCYMHHGSLADGKLMDAYRTYLPQAEKDVLKVKEVPELPPPEENKHMDISLRGVVGFSAILIKIMVTIDAELLCTAAAEKEFLERYQRVHTKKRTLKADAEGARRQIKQYVRQCGFPTPENPEEIKDFLLRCHLISL